MFDFDAYERIRDAWDTNASTLDERGQRLWAAGHAAASTDLGGITLVARATGLSRNTIRDGMNALRQTVAEWPAGRVRLPGGGRKRLTEDDPQLMGALEALIDPMTDPSRSALRWTCKSTQTLAKILSRQRRRMRDGIERMRNLDGRSVANLLHEADYCLRANRKRIVGSELPNRDAQFRYVNDQAQHFLNRKRPVLVVDTGVWVGPDDWRSADLLVSKVSEADQARIDGFGDTALRSLFPGGAAEATDFRQWSSVGIAIDTAQLAVASVRRWWFEMRPNRFSLARELLIAADCGGRDNQRTRKWKAALQNLADDIGATIVVCHVPRGAVKWPNVEQRLLSFDATVRRRQRFAMHQAVVSMVVRTSRERPIIRAVLETGVPRAVADFSDRHFESLCITPASFNGLWNYSVGPT